MLLDLLEVDINRVGMQGELIARGHDQERVGAWACGQDCATAASEARAARGRRPRARCTDWSRPRRGPRPSPTSTRPNWFAPMPSTPSRARGWPACAKRPLPARPSGRVIGWRLRAQASDPELIERAEVVETLRDQPCRSAEQPMPAGVEKDEDVCARRSNCGRPSARQRLRRPRESTPRVRRRPFPCPHCDGPLLVAGGTVRAS